MFPNFLKNILKIPKNHRTLKTICTNNISETIIERIDYPLNKCLSIIDNVPIPITIYCFRSSGNLSWAKFAVPVTVDIIITGIVYNVFFFWYISLQRECIHW